MTERKVYAADTDNRARFFSYRRPAWTGGKNCGSRSISKEIPPALRPHQCCCDGFCGVGDLVVGGGATA